jgi:hypothetical protein
MNFLLYILQFILLISTTKCALNINVNLAEEFLREVYDHIYVQCEERTPRSKVYKFCTSLEGKPCEQMLNKNFLKTNDDSLIGNEIFFFEEFFSSNELHERFSIFFLNNIEWLINHVGIFLNIKDSFFNEDQTSILKKEKKISIQDPTKNILTLYQNTSILSIPFQQFFFLFQRNNLKNKMKFSQHFQNITNKQQDNGFITFHTINSSTKQEMMDDYEIHSTVILASNKLESNLSEYYGSDFKTLSLRWVGLWYNLPYSKLGFITNRDLKKNKENFTKSCIFVNKNDNVIFFSESIVPNAIKVILFHKEKDQTKLASKVVIYVQGILCETQQKGNHWIYTNVALKCLKRYEYQRFWSAKLIIEPQDHLKQINILDHITAGFQYTRINGILISLAEMTKVQMSEGNVQEILTQSDQIDTHGLCLEELHVRYLKKKTFISKQKDIDHINWKQDTRKALVLIHKPLLHQIPSPKSLKNKTLQQSLLEDREKWMQYLSGYIKKRIFKQAIELSLFNTTSHGQLVEKISHQRATLPLPELSSDGYVFHHDMRPFSKSLQFWRHSHIPMEAPLCRIKNLHQHKYMLPLQFHPSTLITTEVF